MTPEQKDRVGEIRDKVESVTSGELRNCDYEDAVNMNNELRDLLSIIDQLQSENEQIQRETKWISCEEQEPPKDGRVIMVGFFSNSTLTAVDLINFRNGKWCYAEQPLQFPYSFSHWTGRPHINHKG